MFDNECVWCRQKPACGGNVMVWGCFAALDTGQLTAIRLFSDDTTNPTSRPKVVCV
uniref:Uncharacterized protein n=1 Tax=Maylandia zebra TaxID=106582 RepID=A0A3P9AT68_9CICH